MTFSYASIRKRKQKMQKDSVDAFNPSTLPIHINFAVYGGHPSYPKVARFFFLFFFRRRCGHLRFKMAEKGEKQEKSIVADEQLWRERIYREIKCLTFFTKYGYNPYNKYERWDTFIKYEPRYPFSKILMII